MPHWRTPSPPTAATELRPLAWAACLGGLMACGLFWIAHDPLFAIAAAVVALGGGVGVGALEGRG